MSQVIKLSDLLTSHDRYSVPHGLDEALGDSYLCKRNLVFGNIREALLGAGYRLSCGDSPLKRNYDGAALLSLQTLLEERVVPYVDNTAVLRSVIRRSADLPLPTRFLLDTVRKNYAFHESCHCIAYNLLTGPRSRSWNLGDEKRVFVAQAVLAESFANMCERMGSAMVDSFAHLVLYAFNSYLNSAAESKKRVGDCVAAFGQERTFQLGYLCYFLTNCGPLPYAPTSVDALFELVFAGRPLNAEERELATDAMNKTFSLISRFREETSVVFFRMFGCEAEFLELARFDFSEDTPLKDAIVELVPELANIALHGRECAAIPQDELVEAASAG